MSSVGQLAANELRTLPHVLRENVYVFDRELGRGAFGTVREGLACNLRGLGQKSIRVAVKTLRWGCTERERVKFLQEATLMNKLDHPNIVRLLGTCLEREPHLLLFELMERGDLLKFLQSSRPKEGMPSEVSLADLIRMSIDVASGCEYLEQNHDIHCDIAARNCLVAISGVVKLADFGMAHDVRRKGYYRAPLERRLPLCWLGPETICTNVFTPKTDIWSFGVLLWELVTLGDEPYDGLCIAEISMLIQGGSRLKVPDHCPKQLYDVMSSCWKVNAVDRPTFVELRTTLLELQRDSHVFNDRPFPPQVENDSGQNMSTSPVVPIASTTTCVSACGIDFVTDGYSPPVFTFDEHIAKKRKAESMPVEGPPAPFPQLADEANYHETLGPSKPEDIAFIVSGLRRQLASTYKSYATLSLFENVKPMPIDDLFVQLEFRTPSGTTVDNYRKIVEQFFDLGGREVAERKMMVVWAQPGQGKTTLVKKICYDWSRVVNDSVDESNAYIAHIELLLVCSLRGVRSDRLKSILEMCVPQEDLRTALRAWLEKNATRFLVLLDGFDELQAPTLCEELHSILFNPVPTFVPPFPIVLTSRPAALRDARIFFSAEIRGLAGDEISKFVQNYCSNDASRVQALRYLEKNATLRERLFTCPLMLAMLCALVESNVMSCFGADELAATQTALHMQICNWMRAKESQKYRSICGVETTTMSDDALISSLGRLAFEKTVCDASRLVFHEAELEGDPFRIDVVRATRVGFLTSDAPPSQRTTIFGAKSRRRFSFLHRLFQEFFAAFYASENPSEFREFVDRMQCKHFISDQFLVFLAGLLTDDKSPAFSVLTECLQAKRAFSSEDYNRSLLALKQRRTMFPTALGTDELPPVAYFEQFFSPLFVQVYNEADVPMVRDALLMSLLKSSFKSTTRYPCWPLNALFASAKTFTFALPRGWDGAFGKLVVGERHFRVALLSRPVPGILIFQTNEDDDKEVLEFSLDDLPRETHALHFTGEADAFLAILRASTFNVCVKHICRLKFCAQQCSKVGNKIDENLDLEQTASTIVTGCIEISHGGDLYFICEERLSDAQWTEIHRQISGTKLAWVYFICRWPSLRSNPSDGQSASALQEEVEPPADSRWTTERLQINSLDFAELLDRPRLGLNALFDSIEAETISLTGCKLSSRVVSSFAHWRHSTALKTIVLTACTSSLEVASIFIEAAKIVATLPSVERLRFNVCEFSPLNGATELDAFCTILENDCGHLRSLCFCNCVDFEASQQNEALRKRAPRLSSIEIDGNCL